MSGVRSYQSRDTVLQEVKRGGLCAILVEGEEQGSDAALLKFILRDVTTEVAFFGRDGRPGVIADLQALIPEMPEDRLYAIVDRDFEDGESVDKCFSLDYHGHLFFWRRYAIENYLLESAWIVETVRQLLWQDPGRIPPHEFQTEDSVAQLLIDLSQQLIPAVAGNATIAYFTSEQKKRHIRVEGRSYFNEGNPEIIIAKLVAHYSTSSALAPDLYSSNACHQRYDYYRNAIHVKAQSLEGIHEVISGKLLLTALHQKLLSGMPGYKIRRSNILECLMVLASKQVPADLRLLVEDRILPRWRKARAASEA